MAKLMKAVALISTLLTIVCAVLYGTIGLEVLFTLMITFGTVAYHFLMRLLVGTVIDLLLKNHVDYRKRWFRVSTAELKLYKTLRVKQWKGKMATYDPGCFNPKIHSWDEIAQSSCQAELVHELIILFSFAPIFASIPFGALPVFLVTSVLAACYDALFVIMQRYNRPRILKMIKIRGGKPENK